jgi:hypothetical protein
MLSLALFVEKQFLFVLLISIAVVSLSNGEGLAIILCLATHDSLVFDSLALIQSKA